MAFEKTHLRLHSGASGVGGGMKVFSYNTTDAQGAVTAADYFTEVTGPFDGFDMSVGDKVCVRIYDNIPDTNAIFERDKAGSFRKNAVNVTGYFEAIVTDAQSDKQIAGTPNTVNARYGMATADLVIAAA